MLKVTYNCMPKFNFNSNRYKYCVLVIWLFFYFIYIISFYFYCNICYSFVDSLTSYCVILNNTILNSTIIYSECTYLMVKIIILLRNIIKFLILQFKVFTIYHKVCEYFRFFLKNFSWILQLILTRVFYFLSKLSFPANCATTAPQRWNT